MYISLIRYFDVYSLENIFRKFYSGYLFSISFKKYPIPNVQRIYFIFHQD